MKDLRNAKSNYERIEIPDHLEFFVRKTIREEERRMKKSRRIKTILSTAAAVLITFTGAVNLSPQVAYALSDIPVVGSFARLITFKELHHHEDNFQADIEIPAVKGLPSEQFQQSINQKYLSEGQKLYKEFQQQMGDMKKINSEHLSVSSGYEVQTLNDRLLVIKRVFNMTQASAYERVSYDNIDKINQIVLTLPSLFQDERYIDVISENIKEQMREQMKSDDMKSYFIDREDPVDEDFERIDAKQNFYINAHNQLVIVFDEYEVAPGSMGLIEFVIPTQVIQPLLSSNTYIH